MSWNITQFDSDPIDILWYGANGVYEHGGNLYAVFRFVHTDTVHMRIKKSTDGGITWTSFDYTTSQFMPMSQSYDPATGLIYIVGVLGAMSSYTRPVNLVAFDCATDTYSAPEDISAGRFASFSGDIQVQACPDGSVVVVMEGDTTAPTSLYNVFVMRKRAGVWSAPTAIYTTTVYSSYLYAIATDTSSNVYLIYDPLSTGAVKMVSYSAANSASADVAVGSIDGYTSIDNALVFGGDIFVSTGNKVYRSSLSSPSFTLSFSPAITIGWWGTYTDIGLITDGTSLYAIYGISGTYPTLTTDQLLISKYLGSDTWDTPSVLLDFLLNPPPGTLQPPVTYSSDITRILSDGSFGVISLQSINVGGDTSFYYYHNVAAPATDPWLWVMT